MFGAGGDLLFDKIEDRLTQAVKEGVKGACSGAAAKMGAGLIAIAVVAMFGVIAIWDVAEWAANYITAVDLRKIVATNLAGTAGGIGADTLLLEPLSLLHNPGHCNAIGDLLDCR